MKFELADRQILVKKSLGLWCSALVILPLDWLTKHLALANLKDAGDPLDSAGSRVVVLIPGLLNLRYQFNTGGAFSLMDDHFVLLTALATVALSVLVFWVYTTPMKKPALWLSFGMIIGGAIGNLGDRLLRGGVIDFIDAHWRNHHWPTFNVADSAICIGMSVIVCLTLFEPENQKTAQPQLKSSA